MPYDNECVEEKRQDLAAENRAKIASVALASDLGFFVEQEPDYAAEMRAESGGRNEYMY